MSDKLSDVDRAILEFAAGLRNTSPRSIGAREEEIFRILKIKPIRYYQRLNSLIDDPAANAEFPLLISRLRRQRERRERERSAARRAH
ncbi:MAG: DUF3263 domain-containing protein [Corynebacterium sp.]|nr:DUF3263 domain-containing protein [Corynebacterium sp.]